MALKAEHEVIPCQILVINGQGPVIIIIISSSIRLAAGLDICVRFLTGTGFVGCPTRTSVHEVIWVNSRKVFFNARRPGVVIITVICACYHHRDFINVNINY